MIGLPFIHRLYSNMHSQEMQTKHMSQNVATFEPSF